MTDQEQSFPQTNVRSAYDRQSSAGQASGSSDRTRNPNKRTSPRVRDAEIRWRVVAAQPFVGRDWLAWLFPHSIPSESDRREIEIESERKHPLVRGLWLLARWALYYVGLIVLGVIFGFLVLWELGRWLDHPSALMVLTVGLAVLTSLLALASAATLPLKNNEAHRRPSLKIIRVAALIGLPPLMYATAASGFAVFEPTFVDVDATPTGWTWTRFYGFMLLNLLTFGATEPPVKHAAPLDI